MAREQFPDDIRAGILAQLTGEYRDGNWCEAPWFLESESEWLRLAGFPLDTCRRLLGPLEKLYPPEVCKKLLLRPFDSGLVFGLFHRWPPFLIPALAISDDLEAVPAALKTPLLGKLRRAESFSSASAELSVWADLVRAGYGVDYEPAVLVNDSVRRPDLGVRAGDDYYLIEVSQLQASAWSKAARILEERLVAGGRAFFDDRLVRIVPSREFLSGTAKQIASFLNVDNRKTRSALLAFVEEQLLPPVRAALELVRARSGEPGRYLIEGIGLLEVTVQPGKEVVSALMPPPTSEDVARRVLRKVLEEARQLQPGRRRLRRGIVVLDIGRAASIVPVAHALAALVATRETEELAPFDNIDALLLRGTWQTSDGLHATAVHPMVNPKATHALPVTNQVMDLFYALGGGWIVTSDENGIRIRSRRGAEYALESPVIPQHDE